MRTRPAVAVAPAGAGHWVRGGPRNGPGMARADVLAARKGLAEPWKRETIKDQRPRGIAGKVIWEMPE